MKKQQITSLILDHYNCLTEVNQHIVVNAVADFTSYDRKSYKKVEGLTIDNFESILKQLYEKTFLLMLLDIVKLLRDRY